ncbi:hypothetical protein B0A52_10198 [Exophiala mesophila]|uniref:Uncharacterized protein n=1 Tax=Exophiala mesophila TaxID=212818 RepID=A0A438MRK1_EXOME|nr:hypothetical protein B0A52_10198 [Exophiala mesophila]
MAAADPDEGFVKSSCRSQSPSGSRQQTSNLPPMIVEQDSSLEASSMFSKRQSSPQVTHEDAGNPMYTSPSSNRRSRTPRPKAFRPQSQSLEAAAIVVTTSPLQTAMVDPPLAFDHLQPEPLAPPHTPCLRSAIDFDHSAKDVPLPVTPGTAGVVPSDEGYCSSLQNDLTARLENTENALVVQKHEYQKTIDKLEILIEDLSRDLHTTKVRFQQKSDQNGVLKMETRRATQEKSDAEERERVTKLALQRSRTEFRELRSVMDMQQNMLREYTIKNQDLTTQRDTSSSKVKTLETSLAETIVVKETCLKELQRCREICQRLCEERKYIRYWTEKIMELKSKDGADYMLLCDHLKNQSVHRTDENHTMSISPLVPQQTMAQALEVASASPFSEISRKESSPHETKIESGLDHELVTTKVFKASFWDKYDLKQVPHSALEMHNLQPLSSNMIKTLNLRLETGNTSVEVIDAILTDALNNFHALAIARNLDSHQIFSSDDIRISEVSTSSSSGSTKPTLKLRIPRVARPVQPVGQRPIIPYVTRHQPARPPRKDSTVSSATSSDVSYHNDRMRIKRRGSSISTTPRTTPESESQISAVSASRFPRLFGLRGGSGGSRRSILSFSSSESWLPSITWCEDQGTPSTGSERGIQTTTKSPRRTHGDGVLRVLGKLYLHAESLILAFIIGTFLITRPFSNSFNGHDDEVFSRHLPENVTMSHPVVDTTVRPLGKMFVTSNPMTLMNTTELLLCKTAPHKSPNESQILTQCANLIEVDGFGDNQTTATTSLQDIQRMVKPVVETQYITVFADGAISPSVSCPGPPPPPPPPPPPVECPKPEPAACPIQSPVFRCPHPYSYPDPCPCLEDIGPKKPFNPTAKYSKMKAKAIAFPPGFPSGSAQRSDFTANMTSAGEQNQQVHTLSDSAGISGSRYGSGSSSPSSHDRPRRPTKVNIIKWGDHVRPGHLGPIPPIQRLLSAIRNKLLS